MLCFHLPAPVLRPGGAAKIPPLVEHLIRLHRKYPELWVDLAEPFARDLPLLVAHDQVQSIQVLHRHYCRGTMAADLEGGKPPDAKFYPAPTAMPAGDKTSTSTARMRAAVIRPARERVGRDANPVGYNRMYVHSTARWTHRQTWWKQLSARAKSW